MLSRMLVQRLSPRVLSLRCRIHSTTRAVFSHLRTVKPRIDIPRISRKSLSTGVGILPKGLFFRIFWTGVTATTGYVWYQINQASSWLSEKFELARETSLVLLLDLSKSWDLLSAVAEQSSGWLPFRWRRKANPGLEEANFVESPLNSENDSAAAVEESDDVQQFAFDQFKLFTKKMIEVRSILRSAELDPGLVLPSIVVIGSQSSGKSSVLESIVGHQFLPKRPLELTLVNSSTSARDFAVFPQMECGPIYDFNQVQKLLTDMNLSVPDGQWISPKPIELTIYSKNVPDLSLVDLPGYIQINNKNQPSVLREKIAELCEKYISQNNIILAICAADVDLANAEALKASRTVDPLGERTIGVITKLDLIDAAHSVALIRNEDYPLKLGYVGVVCKPSDTSPQPKALSILSRKGNEEKAGRLQYDEVFFSDNREAFNSIRHRVGIGSLRSLLSEALESSMEESISGLLGRVQEELTEVRYALKVEYSDRSISPEGYVAYLAGAVKNGLESVAKDFSRFRVRDHLRSILQDRLLGVVEQCFAGKDEDAVFDEAQIRQATAYLTRSGIGRMAANGLVDTIISQVGQTIKDGPLAHHPTAKERLLKRVEQAMRSRCQSATEQVENAIKPIKHELEYTEEEWIKARRQTIQLLGDGIEKLEAQLVAIQEKVGSKRLRKVVQILSQQKQEPLALNPELVDKAQDAVRINYRIRGLRNRLWAIQRGDCSRPEQESAQTFWAMFSSHEIGTPQPVDSDGRKIYTWNECQSRCPEVYLYLVMEKLMNTSALYIHHELVHEFLHPFPDELASSLSTGTSSNSLMKLERAEILQFIQENPAVARHLFLQERCRLLNQVGQKLAYLQHLRDRHNSAT